MVCHRGGDDAQQQKVLRAVALSRGSYVVSRGRPEQKAGLVEGGDAVAGRQGASIKDDSN